MITFSLRIGFLCLLATLSGMLPARANLLLNPGFEDGLDHWEITTGAGHISSHPMAVRNGHSALLTVDVGVVGFQQTAVAVQPDTWYKLTVHSKGKHGADHAFTCYYSQCWSKFYINGEQIYHAWHHWHASSWTPENWCIFNSGTNSVIALLVERHVDAFPPGSEGIVFDDIILEVYEDARPEMLSAVASDGEVELPGIDADDYVTIAFSEPTNKIPIQRLFEISFSAILHPIDIVFKPTNGHSWLDGTADIGEAIWNATGDTLCVYLSTTGGIPSIVLGDTLRPGRCKILDELGNPVLRDAVVLRGSLGPSAVHDNPFRPSLTLHQNAPNPFAGITQIRYQISAANTRDVSLSIYDVTARLLRHWSGRTLTQSGSVSWDGKDYSGTDSPSGIYFCELRAGDEWATKKMILLRR